MNRSITVITGLSLLATPILYANAATKKVPQAFSQSEFASIADQAINNSAAAFGKSRGIDRGAIGGVKNAYFDKFENATIGLVSGGVSVADMINRAQEDGDTCTQTKYSKDASRGADLILSAISYTCEKEGKSHFYGFVKFIDVKQKADHLFWITGNNAGITEATGDSALGRIVDRLQKDYV